MIPTTGASWTLQRDACRMPQRKRPGAQHGRHLQKEDLPEAPSQHQDLHLVSVLQVLIPMLPPRMLHLVGRQLPIQCTQASRKGNPPRRRCRECCARRTCQPTASESKKQGGASRNSAASTQGSSTPLTIRLHRKRATSVCTCSATEIAPTSLS